MRDRTLILVADDDTKLLTALRIRLESEGYDVIVTQDGYQALDFARRHRPDLLLLDVNMPAGSGFSVQERADQLGDLANTPVVYMTGESPGSVDASAEAHGAFSVLHKPLETEELLATVKAALGRKTPVATENE